MTNLDYSAVGVSALFQEQQEELFVLCGAECFEVSARHQVLQVRIAAIEGCELRTVRVDVALLLRDGQVWRHTCVQERPRCLGVAPVQRHGQRCHSRRLTRECQLELSELGRKVKQALNLGCILLDYGVVELRGKPGIAALLRRASCAAVRAAVRAPVPQGATAGTHPSGPRPRGE
eukprot:CAMPEP_0179209526 /NCGR_PEP_ID=MMETSP0796-20121207/104498_1 /TAXON_ID=73915 /ORGANISM="Pyrodinium bahamense, Strain pbaha01" /LENGTH=175 /DNA_ID=CAMNT_0020914485 /DNA_START=661 /DNA_END=1185 /DNA_ORIENTATION=-